MRKNLLWAGVVTVVIMVTQGYAQEKDGDGKVALEPPKTVADGQPIKVAQELKGMPDGVLKVQANADGSFKSLIVKATVEIEDVLGADKGVRLARKEAEIQAKRSLSQWLTDNCVFAEAANKTTVITTKGDSSKDAAGNKVTLRTQKGVEVKVVTEGYAAYSASCLRGLIVLQSEVTADASPRYVLIMGLSQKTMDQAVAAKTALSNTSGTAGNAVPPGDPKTVPGKNSDTPAPEVKTNAEAEEFLK